MIFLNFVNLQMVAIEYGINRSAGLPENLEKLTGPRKQKFWKKSKIIPKIFTI
jgi:hypothetical protein